jgi:hypothetical protein
LCPHRFTVRVDVDALHRREIDHQPVVDRGASGNIVTAAANCDLEAEILCELDGIHDIGHAPAARNQRRPPVDQAVMDLSGLVVTRIAWLEELPGERLAELADSIRK